MQVFKLPTAIFLFTFLWQYSFAQYNLDSLKNELPKANSKAEIYNLLAEATIEDSLELSRGYAKMAMKNAILEKNARQEGIAWFSLAEVFSYQYQLDSAVYHYQKALTLLKQVNDNYFVSYALNNLGWISNNYGQFQEAIDYYTESLDYLDMENHADDLSHIYVNIGNACYQLGYYETSIKYFHNSIAIANSINYEPILTYAYLGIGLSNKYLSNFDSAIYYYKAALEIDEKDKDSLGLAIDYHNIGSLYYEWKQFDQALEYFIASKEFYLKFGSKNDLSLILNNIGNVYRERGKYDMALEHFTEALSIDSATGIEPNIAARFNNIGELYAEQKLFYKALEYYNKSLQLNQKLGLQHNEAVNLHNIGDAYVKLKSYRNAQAYFEEGLLIADSIHASSTIIRFLASLTELNKLKGNFEQALDYHIRYSNLKDSTFKENSQRAMADMKSKFDVNKKDQEIALLNNKSQFQKLEVNAYKTRMIYLIIGIVLISMLSFFLVVQYSQKNKAYKKLVEQSRDYLNHEKQISSLLSSSINRTETSQNQYSNEEENDHHELLQELLHYFEKEEPFLNHDTNLKEIAIHLNTNPKYISQVINTNFDKNFNTFVNEYRVRLAMKYLANGIKKQYSIEGISAKVGFHSKSAFNVAFKKMTGITPSYYIKSIKKESETV